MSTKSNKGPIIAGFACLFIADLIILFIGIFSWFFSGPLCLAAFILSLVGISNGSTKSGLLLLLLTLSTPVIMQVLWFFLVGVGIEYSQSGNWPILS